MPLGGASKSGWSLKGSEEGVEAGGEGEAVLKGEGDWDSTSKEEGAWQVVGDDERRKQIEHA